ncbi:MAG: methyl-accepting chemotaxis protein [Alphaproteobacteria bacterium]|uniref:Methyl-accepting chemotaxis protein n=1 Tax=Candidatus Nitrobium versatile TaxID=2884831 RepID=A0A953J3W3_9BACT|nr:methyl-accepting chemotaxis protein [Candidatus Nitrobium versatile]
MELATLVLGGGLAVSVLANIFLLIRKNTDATGELRSFFAEQNKGRASLARSFTVQGSSTEGKREIAEHLNSFLNKIGGVYRNVFSDGLELVKLADTLKSCSDQTLEMSQETSSQAAQVAAAMEEMSSTINDIVRNINQAVQSGNASTEHAKIIEKSIKENVSSIEMLSANVMDWAGTSKALSEATERIDGIIVVIKDIADQTNLLALNAAIEAARAGEQGRGFAVVADEVRKLADKTGKATQEIAAMIRDVKTKADSSLDTMDSTLKGVNESIERTKKADEYLKKTIEELQRTADMVHHIATATEEQSKVTEEVLSNMERVSGSAARTKELTMSISASKDSLLSLALKIYGQLCSVKKDTVDESMEELLITCTNELKQMLEKDIKAGKTDRASLFDENYSKVDEKGKLSTRHTRYFESEVLPLLKKWVQSDRRLIYTVVMDRNGYMPTHLMPARAGMKMEDPISLGGAKSSVIIGKAFRRPMEAGGEVVIDVACPLVINGQHWGCFRIGYLPQV